MEEDQNTDPFAGAEVVQQPQNTDPFADAVVVSEPQNNDPFGGAVVVGEGTTAEPATPNQPAFRQFTSDIYDNMRYPDAVRTFQEFRDSPYTSNPFLGLGYSYQTNPETGEGTYITPPSPTMSGGAKTANIDLVATGAYATLGHALELGAAGIDALFGTNLTEDAGNLIPGVNNGDSFVDAAVSQGVPILVSSLMGYGLASRALQGTPWLVRGIGTALGAEVPAVAVSPNDAGTLITGENALLPVLRGIDLEDGAANDVIEARLNLLADSLLAGRVLQAGVQGTAAATRFAYGIFVQPIVTLLRGNAGMEDAAIRAVLDQLTNEVSNLSPADMGDPNIRFQIGERITRIIEENRQVLVPYLNNLDEDLPVDLDSMTALIRGLNDGADPRLVARAEGLRRGRMTSPMVLQRVNQPSNALEAETRAYLESIGGATPAEQTATMGAAADALADSGRREVQVAADAADAARAEYQRSATELIADLSNDVELSDEIRRLAEATGTQIDTTANASLEQIRDQITAAYEIMNAQKNSLYGAIDGGPIDVGSLYDAFANVAIDELSAQSRTLQRTSPLRDIAELLQPRMVPDDTVSDSLELAVDAIPGTQQMRQETREEVIARVEDWFARDPDLYNFGFFQRVIRPELNQIAEGFFSSGQPMAARVVRSIIRTIDEDMVDFVADTAPELAEAAVDARRYYREEFAPLFRDGRLQEIADLHNRTIGRASDIGPVDYAAGSRAIVRETLQSGDQDLIGQFRDLLARGESAGTPGATPLLTAPSGAASPNPLAEYMVASAISDAADSLRASGGVDAQLGGFISRMRQYSAALNELFPQRAEELNAFIRRVEQAQGNRIELQRVMDEAQANLDATVTRVRNGELSSFFRQDFGNEFAPIMRNLATASDPQAAFSRVLDTNRNDTTALVQALMDRADAMPPETRQVVMDGMRTAYMRVLRSRFMGRVEMGGGRSVNPAQIQAAEEQMRPILSIGDTIFRDTPELMESINTLTELAGLTAASRNASPISPMSATEFNRQATSATNRLIYTLIGPLTRTGTRIRAISSGIIQTLDPEQRAAGIMDRILADPDYFVELSRRYNRQPNDQQAQQALLNAFLTAGVRINQDDAADLELQMRETFGQ